MGERGREIPKRERGLKNVREESGREKDMRNRRRQKERVGQMNRR